MTVEEIYSMLTETGLEVAYYQFPVGEAPELPYIVYYFPDNDDFFADNSNYVGITSLNVELYTKDKDFDMENALINVLKKYGLTYDRDETYLTSEKMYEVLFELEVFING